MCYGFRASPAAHAIAMRATFITLLVATLSSSAPAFARQVKEKPEQIRLTNDLKHYQGMVGLYRQGNDDMVAELLTWDEARLETTIAAINSLIDPNRPWGDDFLKSGAVLQTAAALRWLNDGDLDHAVVYLKRAAAQLRRGSSALAPFSGRCYYATSRLFLSLGDADRAAYMLDGGRQHVPDDPLVLYASGTRRRTNRIPPAPLRA